MTQGLIMLLIMVPMFVLNVFLLRGQGANLLAGYNTMSKEKKMQYDKVKLCKFTGKVLILPFNIGWIIASVFTMFHVPWADSFMVGFVVVYCIFLIPAVIYMNTGNRFKKY